MLRAESPQQPADAHGYLTNVQPWEMHFSADDSIHPVPVLNLPHDWSTTLERGHGTLPSRLLRELTAFLQYLYPQALCTNLHIQS